MPSKKHPGGRPTKLTPKIQAALVDYLSIGNYIIPACLSVGISEDTFYGWMRRWGCTKSLKQAHHARSLGPSEPALSKRQKT